MSTVWRYEVHTVNLEYTVVRSSDDANGEAIPFRPLDLEALLNDRGEEGWELTGFLPALPAEKMGGIAKGGQSPNPWIHYLVFKKPEDPQDTRMRRSLSAK